MTSDASTLTQNPAGGRIRTAFDTADWRLRVFDLYARVRAAASPQQGHAVWVDGRDELFATHPASPLLPADRAGFAGLPVEPYDPAWRFEVELIPAEESRRWDVETGTDGIVPFELLGRADVPKLGSLDVWRLSSYGGGRYLIDTIKGAWLGEGAAAGETLVLDFNFAYNPSCAYDEAWACPLAPLGNTLPVEVPVGERYRG